MSRKCKGKGVKKGRARRKGRKKMITKNWHSFLSRILYCIATLFICSQKHTFDKTKEVNGICFSNDGRQMSIKNNKGCTVYKLSEAWNPDTAIDYFSNAKREHNGK